MDKILHQPLGGNEMPRFGGIATMMRLPHLDTAAGLDAAFIGVPLDIGVILLDEQRHDRHFAAPRHPFRASRNPR